MERRKFLCRDEAISFRLAPGLPRSARNDNLKLRMSNSSVPPVPIGYPLFMMPDENGALQFPNLDASVRQSIRVILSTRPGEQLMRPEFGAGVENFLFEANTIVTRRRLRDAIQQSLEQWEKRIVVDRIDVLEVQDDPGQLRVEIWYRLKRTNAPQQFGLTLALEA